MIEKISLYIILLSLLTCSILTAVTSYTGYSGAPLSRGTCASSCHGSSGGTIAVTGFPSVYDPGVAYPWVRRGPAENARVLVGHG